MAHCDEQTDPEVLTWEGFGAAVRSLASSVTASKLRPDIVLSIARGGMIVGGALGYALDVKHACTINVEYYTGVDERLDKPIVLPPAPDPELLRNRDVLIVDDVADTGHTLALVTGLIREHVREARTCTLYRKPRSTVVPDFSWREVDTWITFPWSSEPPIS